MTLDDGDIVATNRVAFLADEFGVRGPQRLPQLQAVTIMLAVRRQPEGNEKPNSHLERIVFMSSWRMLGGVICSLMIGCATDPFAAMMSDPAKQRARVERQEQLKRDWQLSREHGRIGYVGHQAPALEGTTVPPP